MNKSFDPAKQAINDANHGIFFSEAIAFDWEKALLHPDNRRAYGESRFVAIAPIGSRLHVMVFTLRGTSVRIISLRKANRREAKHYADHH